MAVEKPITPRSVTRIEAMVERRVKYFFMRKGIRMNRNWDQVSRAVGQKYSSITLRRK